VVFGIIAESTPIIVGGDFEPSSKILSRYNVSTGSYYTTILRGKDDHIDKVKRIIEENDI